MKYLYKKSICLFVILFACIGCIQAQSPCPPDGGNDGINGGSSEEGVGDGAAGHGDFDQDASQDPNEIVGIDGWLFIANGDTVRWVSASQRISYTIYFENDPLLATASAQVVTVRLPLDPLMNLQDFAIGTFGFSNRVFPVEGNSPVYQTRLDLVQEMNLYVDVVAGIDITTNEAFWIFSSIDPVTGVAPTETDRGFLPVNDSTHAGEGFVTFTIKPKTAQCHTGDSIVAQATIVFDINDPIETNRWVNTIDAVPPVSIATMIQETPDSLYIAFSGADDTTGIAAYRLYYTEGRSAYRMAGRYLPGDTAMLEKHPNTQYTFFSLAEDNVGNIEPMKNGPDTLFGNTHVNLLASVTPAGAASITGTGTYDQGDTATLLLHPSTGYRLTRWVEAGIPQGTDTLLSIVVDGNHSLVAEMERLSYPLTVDAAEGTSIEVISNGQNSTGAHAYQTVQHFDTLNIHLSALPCYNNVAYQINSSPLLNDTSLVVTEAITLTSTATTHIGTGYVYDTICPGTAYTANGFNILSIATQTSGTFSFRLSHLTSLGCDSIAQLQLTVRPSYNVTFHANGGQGGMANQKVCSEDATVLRTATFTREGYNFAGWSMTVDGTIVYSDGDIITTDSDLDLYAVWSSGCVDRLNNRIVTACDGLMWRGSFLSASGTYSDTIIGVVAGGCDSIYSIILTVRPTTNNVMDIVACSSYQWIDGTIYDQDTNRTLSFTNSVGCDSVVTLHLTMSEPTFTTDVQTVCDSMTWIDGIKYFNSTSTPQYTFNVLYGCDSTVTLNLTVNHSNTAVETVTACNSYVWHGNEYTSSTNSTTFTCENTAGCDSVTTLYLTIDYCSTTTITSCDSFFWHGNTYTHSGTYTDGADTLLLTINYSNTGDTSATACDSFSWWNTIYTNSTNNLTHVFTNSSGCDSVVTLNLTINYSTVGYETATACDSYNWNGTEYNTSGVYIYLTTNAAGCDSLVTLNLTVNYSVTVYDSLTIATGDVPYNYHGNNVDHAGEYTFDGTTTAGCDSTTLLHVEILEGIDMNDPLASLKVYPNPTRGTLTIDSDDIIKVEVFDINGRLIASFENTNSFDISSLASGNYSLRIATTRGDTIRRIVKK